MGNSTSVAIPQDQIDDFCLQCRPLDLLVFRGHEGVSNIIRKLQGQKVGNDTISHVEVVITPEWCERITSLTKKFEAFPTFEKITPHPKYLLSWGSTLSGKLNDGVNNAETGGVKFGVQVRDLRELVSTYASRPGANVGVCRLKLNPTDASQAENLSEPGATATLKQKIAEAYDKYHDSTYNFNILDLLAAIYPEFRPARDKLNKVIRKFLKGDEFMFCSEFAASLYRDLGIINDSTDGKVDGETLDPGNVVPVDFLGHDADTEGIRVELCEPPIWIKPLDTQ